MRVEMVERLHKIMASGTMSECMTHIPTGNCHCCEFDPVLGNWIGVLQNEEQILQRGNTNDWNIFTEEGSGNTGIICKRNPAGCDNKPLDCMLYPFFPLSYDGEEMVVLAGFPKCPMKATFIESMGNFKFSDLPPISMANHLKKVIAVGYILNGEGHADWMMNVGSNYKGYNVRATIKAKPAEIEEYLSSLNLG